MSLLHIILMTIDNKDYDSEKSSQDGSEDRVLKYPRNRWISVKQNSNVLGHCAHVTGLLFALLDYIESYGTDPSCTSKLCSWNTGRQTKKDQKAVTVTSYGSRQRKPVDDIIDHNPTPNEPSRACILEKISCSISSSISSSEKSARVR